MLNPFEAARMEPLRVELYTHADQGIAESLLGELLQLDHEAAWRLDHPGDSSDPKAE